MSLVPPPAPDAFAALRRFTRPRKPLERCELCSAELSPEHQHLMELSTRQMTCSCDPCAILFSGQQSGRFRRIPRRIQFLRDFRLTDEQWNALLIPINIAFFSFDSSLGKVTAMYPSPAGATQSLLTLDMWQAWVDENPLLATLEPDVEALLVNRVGTSRDYYRLPIDRCFNLVGLIRTHWRGLSGGAEVWKEIEQFLSRLQEQSDA